MQVGSLVTLLDYRGDTIEGWIGSVLGFDHRKGRVLVHWHAHPPDRSGSADPSIVASATTGWPWGRLEVLV